MKPDLDKIVIDTPLFLSYQQPHGFLAPKREAHALWYYYIMARRNYEHQNEGGRLELDGQRSTEYNYRQLFTSVARMYGVHPDDMKNHWSEVDMQCVALRLPKLPTDDQYRFNAPLEIRGN